MKMARGEKNRLDVDQNKRETKLQGTSCEREQAQMGRERSKLS